jgi:hypothetical protein
MVMFDTPRVASTERCATLGHDFRALLATRVGHGDAWGAYVTPARFLVRACSRCGERP